MTARRTPRRPLSRKPSRRLHHQTLERRELLAAEIGGLSEGPRLISVAANSGEQFDLQDNNRLSVAPTELTFRFGGGQQLREDTLSAIQFTSAGGDGSFDEGNEEQIVPGFLGFRSDQGERIVVARFAETLQDDQYLVEIAGYDDSVAGIVGLRNVEDELFVAPDPDNPQRPTQEIRFEVEVGPRVVSVVPQPVEGTGAGRIQHRDQIHVYFNDDPLSNPAAGPISSADSGLPVVNPDFYKLIYTEDTVENTDDAVLAPAEVRYDPATNRAVLIFDDDLSELAPAAAKDGAGTYRLRVGSGEALPQSPSQVSAAEGGDTFGQSQSLGVSFGGGTQSIVVTDGLIRSQRDVIPPWPGASDAAGLRHYRRDAQIIGRPDTQTGISVFPYNFADLYGLDPQLNQLDNAITEAQKQRAREVLALYAERLGVQFVETENSGLQIVTGDLRSLAVSADAGKGTPYSIFRVNDEDPTQGVLVLDAGENWYDGYGLSPDARPSWFVEAVRGVGSLLGIGNLFELPDGVGAGGSSPDEPNSTLFSNGFPAIPPEPEFLSQSDIAIGQALHRPESSDVDFYSFTLTERGHVTAETFAQRLEDSSFLDTHLELYRVVGGGAEHEMIASNDDFFSEDSSIGVDLEPGDYIIGVSASGNDEYDGEVDGSGIGGVTEGSYQLRVDFEPKVGATITDTNGTELDGDADGQAGGDFNFWFRVARDPATASAGEPRTIFVDKTGNDSNDGSLASPLRTISQAFSRADAGDLVRLLPNGGADGLVTTNADNQAYEIGKIGNNVALSDGAEFEVPRGVTVMIDAGAVLKLRNAKISVGSESVDEDRSLAALQVLGAPILTETGAGGAEVQGSGEVFFTSYDDEAIGADTNPLPTTPAAGNWAGVEFRNDFDYAEGRPVWETEGIFLDYVSHANMQYGGGSISATRPVVTPIQMSESRPTLIHNTIRNSADAAISADPDSFLETNFHAPVFQRADAFTSDYDRVGPEISGNRLLENSINGLFVRVDTPAAGQLEPMTVSGRMDDRDIVHVISQVLVLQGQPGGPLMLENRPDVRNVTLSDASGGTLASGQGYDYRLTFVTEAGDESPASLSTRTKVVPSGGAIRLNNLPVAPERFAGRRLYRFEPATGEYQLVTQLDRGTRSYIDDGETRGGLLPGRGNDPTAVLPRYNARLSIDPGLVFKLQSARIEASAGADFYAEGADGQPIVFTSRLDDSYGAGGTFDTNNDGSGGTPAGGDWGGLVFRQDSTASLDYAEISYAGGTTPIEGGFTEFNPVEILQADVRIAHSTLRENADGFESRSTRAGRGFNGPAAIFVRGSQPIIVDNTIVDNEGAAVSINPDSLNFHDVLDHGRSTGRSDIVDSDQDNQGPLVSGNRLDRNDLNGMLVRSEVLTTESVWDDSDVVHVVGGEIHSMTHHYRSGLRLKSDPNQSLVVKFDAGARLVGSGRPLDIEDRVGGTLQVLGQGGFPVILTSLADDTVGAGFTPGGVAQTDTDNADATPQPGDWEGLQLLSYVNDRNVAYVLEDERAIPAASSENAVADDAQVVGDLARDEFAGDENERLGFNIRGTLADPADHDVYRFSATGGTELYIDIDDTTFGLDTVVELIDVNNNVLAASDNSFAETTDPAQLVNNLAEHSVRPLFKLGVGNVESPNPLDAGMRVVLPGSTTGENVYYVRVRNAAGNTSGQYQLSLRLRETDEIAGSTVQLADIRYATDAVTVSGTPLHSPLVGDAGEHVNYVGGEPVDVDNRGLSFSEGNAQRLGNLATTDRATLVVDGEIGNVDPNLVGFDPITDVDVYQVDLFAQQIEPDVFDSENRYVTTSFDVDYADGLGRVNTSLSVYNSQGQLILHSRDSNLADDVGRPTEGVDSGNLSAGSAGVLDAFIGPVELPEGTYYVAVSNAATTPAPLNQFFRPNPVESDVRLMPVNSVRRIAEDSLEFSFDQQLKYTAEAPIVGPIFDQDSIVPYTLDDMRLFISLDRGLSGNNRSTLTSFNPFTGALERTIGDFGPGHSDLAIRRDGELYTYSTRPPSGPSNNGNVGNFLNISPVDASATNQGDDDLTFQRNNDNFDDTEADPNAQLIVDAMAFPLSGGSTINKNVVSDQERFFAVGSRDSSGRAGEVPSELRRNILYSMVASNGEATSRGSTDPDFDRDFGNFDFPYSTFFGPAAEEREFGVIDTGFIFDSGGDGGDITGLAFNPNGSGLFAVTDRGGVHLVDPTNRVAAPLDSPAAGYGSVIPTTFFGTVPVDPAHGASKVELTSVTFGPRQIEDGSFRDTMFGVTDDGWLYAFRIDGDEIVPANVFYNGRSALRLTTEAGGSVSGPVGVAFSTLENNPWHRTDDREDDFGHGMFFPDDRSRIRTTLDGGNSLYYGFEITANEADNTIERPDNDALGALAPGGSHGTVISRPFNLQGYDANDKPTVYFNYHIEVENNDDYRPGVRAQNDSFRVFGAGDDGQWQLLTTNNDYRALPFDDEYDYYDETQIPVQEIYDDTQTWRQARVDISPLAGNENVRLRFDFSTAGSMRTQFDSFELVGRPGNRVDDHETFTLRDDNFRSHTFENIVGKDVVIPDGSALANGDSFSVTGPGGTFTVRLVTSAAAVTGPGDVLFSPSDSAETIAENIIEALPKSLRPYVDGDGRISLLAASNVTVAGEAPIAQSNPVEIERNDVDQFVVPAGDRLDVGEEVTFTGGGTSTTLTFVDTASGAPGEILFSPTDTAADIAGRVAAALPNALNAVVETSGRISFFSTVTISIEPAPAANDFETINTNESGALVTVPTSGDDLIDGETVTLENAAGDEIATVRFVESASPTPPSLTVHFQDDTSQRALARRLVQALPFSLSASLTGQDGEVQILGATSATANDADTLIDTDTTTVDPNADVLNLQIADGSQLTGGERLSVAVGQQIESFRFVRAGTPFNDRLSNPVFFTATTTGAELYDDILQSLPLSFRAYINTDGTGINVAAGGASAAVEQGIPSSSQTTADVHQTAIPVTVPHGSLISDGEQIAITSRASGSPTFTFTFVRPGSATGAADEIVVDSGDSAADVTQSLLDALPPSLKAITSTPRELTLLGASSVVTVPGSKIVSFAPQAAGQVPVLIDSTMTSPEVAQQLRLALAEGLGRFANASGENTATVDHYKLVGADRIRVFNATVGDPGPYGVSGAGQFGLAMPGDEFGQGRSDAISNSEVTTAGAANNQVEGVYIDDIIIGFAERGEMVLNAPAGNRDFALNPELLPDSHPQTVQPERQNEILTGNYSLEVRSSDEYGVPQDYDPINLILDETSGLGRSFDTNDRLADGAVTLIAQAGQDLLDGDTFVLDDGVRQLTFEFDSILDVGVAPGHVAVPFDPSGDDADPVAAAMRDAINSPQSQDVLSILAATHDSREQGASTGNRVELFGSAISVNPSGGRFVKMDLVAEETFQGRETSKQIPVVDHDSQTVTYVNVGDTLARAAVSGYADGTTDTLVAVGKIGDRVLTGEVVDDAPVVFNGRPSADSDTVRIYLEAGQAVDIDVDTAGFTKARRVLTRPLITVFDDQAAAVAQSSLFTSSSAPGEADAGAFLGFTAPENGYYDVTISSAFGGSGEYQLTIRPDADASAAVPDRDVVMVDYHYGIGDVNRVREQGQIVIDSNFISNSSGHGVTAGAGPRGQAFASNGNQVQPDNLPRPGAARLLRNQNTDDLIPGAVISNNVVVRSGAGGILFQGGTQGGGEAPAPVPFGRIVNNTIVGDGSGSGVTVASAASPTLLNNIVSGFNTGFDVDASSEAAGTVVGGNAFQNNNTDSTLPLASSSISIPAGVALFQEPGRDIYIPANGSEVIDSSFASLPDRDEFFNTVKEPVGISPSPIIAPSFDAYGQPRVDDPLVTTPGGVGANVFIDRGALDRADDDRPVARLINPQDAIGTTVPGGDGDSDLSFVRLSTGTVGFFEIQLLDPAGTGPDKDTITEESVLLTENGERLRPGVDYVFGYSDNSRTIRLTPLSGLWRPDAVYEITLNNQPRIAYEAPRGDQITDGDQVIITDKAGNQSVFEYDSGYSISIPQTTLLTITGNNTSFQDRDTFTIEAPSGESVTFEIDRTGSTAANNVAVDLSNAGTVGEVRDAILDALTGSVGGTSIPEILDIVPVAVGLDQIQLGTLADHTVTGTVAGLNVSGQAGGVADGQTFSYGSADGAATFEFDSDGDFDPANKPVSISRADTPDEIAASIVAAVSTSNLGLAGAQAIGDGGVLLGGVPGDTLTLDNSTLSLLGTPGVSGKLTLTVPDTATGADIDGSTFSIDVDGTNVTFQYTLDGSQTSANELIVVAGDATPAEIAQQTAAEISGAFPEELAPVVSGAEIALGEPPAIPEPGDSPSLTVVDEGNSGLVVEGVSGGAIPVSFLPTSQFSSAAAAATLQAAINDSPLNVETFSPGGGTVLIENAASVEGRIDGGPITQLGTAIPAVADLSGNRVRETRINDETRFTVIMPEVVFDFGDAPASYATLLADNGARHAVGGERTPRLGAVLDTETNGQPVDTDDAPLSLSASASGGVFDVTSSTNRVDVTVTSTAPTGGETLTLEIGGNLTTFELVDPTSNPSAGSVAVSFTATDTPELIAARLETAIDAKLANTGGGVRLSQETADPASFTIEALDDEDGVSVGTFVTGGNTYHVFTVPGADETNVAGEEILGFLNPLDPAGAKVAVTATGGGLLDAWIDYNRNGIFEADDEQVLKNAPVVDGVNVLTIAVPENAPAGDTWARFRVSGSGNLSPSGVAVGGEVEDYQVSVLPVPTPTPIDDAYTTTEDTTLSVTSATDALIANDVDLGSQILPPRVFVVDSPGNGTVTITDEFTGTFEYVPDADFNGTDTFTYQLSAQQAVGNGQRTTLATVTITVDEVNDPPQFDLQSTVELLEQDNGSPFTAPGVISDSAPGPDTATDELADQSVNFAIDLGASDVPPGLFQGDPTINDNGDLIFTPSVDAFGTAELVVTVSDDHPTDPLSESATITVHVRPVNDPPGVDPSRLGEANSAGADNQYVVSDGDDPAIPNDQENDLGRAAGTILYTMAEDEGPFFVPLSQQTGGLGFSRIGLFDVISVGPQNESENRPGGPQSFLLQNVPKTTRGNGTLAEVRNTNGDLIGFNYTPPQNFNSSRGATDAFNYTVVDDNPSGGETWSLAEGGLVEDPKVSNGSVEIIINPVNDRPVFDVPRATVEVAEDSGLKTVASFATSVAAGPPTSAFDEVDINTGQEVSFTVSSLTFPFGQADQFFSVYPTLSNDGDLTFQPAPNVFGEFEFEVVLTDDGPDNSTRGDLVSSVPQTITVDIQPVNDPPQRVPGSQPQVFSVEKNEPIEIPLRGTGGTEGLFDRFMVGPANEAADIAPQVGGNQTLSFDTPLPAETVEEGTVELVSGPGGELRLRYTPANNFTGTDSFTYTVNDGGVTVDVGTDGAVRNDPRLAGATVTFTVKADTSPLQNPGSPHDVNDDGFTTAIDALLIINRLERAGGSGGIPVEPTDVGPPFYDVSGDETISSLDALRVINELRRQQVAAGEAIVAAPQEQRDRQASESLVPEQTSVGELEQAEKVIGEAEFQPLDSNVVELLAADRDSQEDQEDSAAAIDAAMADLL